MLKKVYIAGAISGKNEKLVEKQFRDTQVYLEGLGYTVINPVEIIALKNKLRLNIGLPLLTDINDREAIMKTCFMQLLQCNYIFMMPGWEESKGAKQEYNLAQIVGVKVLLEQ